MNSAALLMMLAANKVQATIAIWHQVQSTGFEYMLSSGKADYSHAVTACSKFGDGASMASPTSDEANTLVANIAPAGERRYIGLVNTNDDCGVDNARWMWDSGAVSFTLPGRKNGAGQRG